MSRAGITPRTAISYAAFAVAYLTCSAIVAVPQAFGQTVRTKPKAAQTPLPQPASPMIAIVSIGRQRITVYDKNGVVTQSPISSGRSGFDTPQGVFSIIEKKEEHFSNLYDDAPMPFMQRITWSGVALHAGSLPGYPASHGCIRLPHSFSENLFKMTRMNTRVVVLPGDTQPVSISHPALFQPRIAQSDAVATAPRSAPSPAIEIIPSNKPNTFRPPADAGESSDKPMMLGGRIGKPLVPEPSEPAIRAEKAVITPLEAARAQRNAAAQKAAAAARAADSAKLVHKAKLGEVVQAQRAVGPLDLVSRRAETRSQQLAQQVRIARTEEQAEKAREVYVRSLEDAILAARALRDGRRAITLRQDEVKTAFAAIKPADEMRVAAANEARAAERLTEPVSVFVSRKAQRVYVRQGRVPVGDFPVTIRDAARPMGTYVFTAVEQTNGGRQVNWKLVTVQSPTGSSPGLSTEAMVKGKKYAQTSPSAPEPVSPGLAAAALERIEFPNEALDRITPYIQPGSSLIVSDLGMSVETGQGTDFVVQTKGEAESIVAQQKYAREAREKANQKVARRY